MFGSWIYYVLFLQEQQVINNIIQFTSSKNILHRSKTARCYFSIGFSTYGYQYPRPKSVSRLNESMNQMSKFYQNGILSSL